MDIKIILEKTVSPHQEELLCALNYLEQAAQQNLPELLRQLSTVLREPTNGAVARTQAGLQLKNAIYSHDQATLERHRERWAAFSPDIRSEIKDNILCSLGTETVRPSIAAQCVACIAVEEIPRGEWPDLIDRLNSAVVDQSSSSVLKEAALETIGYICHDIDHEVLLSKSNQILTFIVHGIRKAEPSDHVRLAAANALLNSLEFTSNNFDVEPERDLLMRVICEATLTENTRLHVAALECLVKVASLYHDYLENYLMDAIIPITTTAMKDQTPEVALQGIEFWSTICDVEADDSIPTVKLYATVALPYIIPILTKRLAERDAEDDGEDDDDDDEWIPSKAASVCIMLLANCCKDAVVEHALPFVANNIKDADWQNREAAVMAFGSILEGPNPDKLKPLVEHAMPTLIELFSDSTRAVRDTVAWSVGRICDTVPEAVINTQFLDPVLRAMVVGLDGDSKVAASICWSLSSLARESYGIVQLSLPHGRDVDTTALSPHFELLVQKLLSTAERQDSGENNLRTASYDALMELVKSSPKDCYPVIQKTVVFLLERVQHIFNFESLADSHAVKMQCIELQSLTCTALQSMIVKMTADDLTQLANPILSALMHMLACARESHVGALEGDALFAVGTIAEVLGKSFAPYMDTFKPYLMAGLGNSSDDQVVIAAIGVVGDLSRSLGHDILPYCEEILHVLQQLIMADEVKMVVKPHLLSIFGDIALAIGSDFVNYSNNVLNLLDQASRFTANANDVDMMEYMDNVRGAVMESFTGIIQGLKDDVNPPGTVVVSLIEPHVEPICQLLERIASDDCIPDTINFRSCGLIGDMLSVFGSRIAPLFHKDCYRRLFDSGKVSAEPKTKQSAQWAMRELRRFSPTITAAG